MPSPPAVTMRTTRQPPAARAGTPTSVTSRPSGSRSPATRRWTSPLPPAVKSPLEVPTNATRPAASMVGSEKLERMPIGEGSPALATRRGSTAPAAGAASHRTSSSDARTISGAMPASPVPPRPRHGRGGFDHGRRAAPCRAAAIVHRCTTLVPKLAYQLREPVEGRAAVDPPLARAPPPLRALDVAELGEPRERVAEGDDRAALPLVHLAEQATRGELPTHPLDERPLGDRPFLLPRHGAGRHEIGLAEVFEHARGRAHERVGGLHDVAHERTRLAVVGEESGDLAAEGVAVGQRELPAIEVEPPRHVGLQRLGRDSREQAARHQRRDQEEVDGVVLVEVEVHALAARNVQHDALAVDEPFDEPAPFEPGEALAEVRGVVAHQRGGEMHALGPQQLDERVGAREEVRQPARRARRAEQRGRAHRRGPRDGHRIHLAQEPKAQPLDEAALLLLERRVARGLLQAGTERPERFAQRDGLAVAHVGGAVAPLEDAARPKERTERLPLLRLAQHFAGVRLLLGNAPVVDRDRHEVEVATHPLQEGVHDCREHAELRREDLSRPRAPALDEELLRVAFADEKREVLPEHHLVELVVVEGAPDEERARTAEERSERPEVEVVARGDVRRRQVVGVEDVAQDQVVEVAAVAGDEDDRVLLHALDHALEPDDLEPGEHARPDAVEEDLDQAEVEPLEVGGHLVDVSARLLEHPPPGHPALGRQAPDEPRQLRIAEHLLAHDAPGQQRRSPDHALLAVEKYLERPREPAHEALLSLAGALLEKARQRDLAPERELRLLGVPHVGEQALGLARGLLHAVEERSKAGLAPPQSRAAEDGDRHEEDGPGGALRRAHHVAEELRADARGRERTALARGDGLAAHEEQHRLAGRDQLGAGRVRALAVRPAPPRPAQPLAHWPPPARR